MNHNTEKLACWYLRLNGYFSIVNFVIHPESRGSQLTDADILAIRFPFSRELKSNPMVDDSIVTDDIHSMDGKIKICFLIGEVKTGLCNINGPWKNPDKENMQRVLRRIGFVEKDEEIELIAQCLYKHNMWVDDSHIIRQVAFGAYKNTKLPQNIVQVIWDDIASFIYNRFWEYQVQKAQHDQWEDFIKEIFVKATANGMSKDDFINWIKNDIVGLSSLMKDT